jgi:hypothetical protein
MKKPLLILTIFCIALLAVNVAAETPNKDLPTKKEVKAFVNDFDAEDDFISEISDAAKEEHPDWKWDIWGDSEYISVYYTKGNGGYGSIYYDADGDKVKLGCGEKPKLKTQYKGKA